ncbi:hypothetical protein SG34_007240 [Thalassomonas viridans]|uniref:Uncharacterized protein n=1 Tax=Thalassomonas viridans TaxID=137584 RepID=A0AAF0CAN0_9GAMM|nr:hypothetical protein [Thalassomonas viridans]WDE06691.1 hypothetical protein SG34_007240 [Thalassomonas viridans]
MKDQLIIKDVGIIKKCRAYLRRLFPKRGYDGWCDAFDEQYDDISEWFAVGDIEKGGAYAFCRVTYKTADTQIPTELGDIDSHLVFPAGSCEINNLIYSERNTELAAELISKVLEYLKSKGLNLAFCVVDKDDRHAHKLNTEVFLFKETGCTLIYPGVVHKEKKTPVIWQVLRRQNIDRDCSIKPEVFL